MIKNRMNITPRELQERWLWSQYCNLYWIEERVISEWQMDEDEDLGISIEDFTLLLIK